jgi:beta-lactamase regulating signal transducer with metallopeptidase domain/biopolymer transport protein ExbD
MNRIATSIVAALAAAVPAIVDSALKGVVLLALVALGVALLRQASAAARHLVWLLGVVGLLLLPVLSAALPGWRVLPRWASISSSPTLLPLGTTTLRTPAAEFASPNIGQVPLSFIDAEALSSPGPAQPASTSGFSRANLGPMLTGVWLAVAALLLLRVIVSLFFLRLSGRRVDAVTTGPIWEALQSACAQLCIRRRIRLLLDERRTVPLVWGILRPRLLLPAEARTWDESRLRAVLLHELAHVKRLDLLVLLLTQIACALHWFNPLVWLAAWRMHVERERACDNLVLNSGVKASDYAEHLLQVATTLETDSPSVALAMARPSRLEGRLLSVLSEQVKRGGVNRAIALLAVAVGLGIIIPIGMLRADDNAAVEPIAPNNSTAIEPAADPNANPTASPPAESPAANADVLTLKADGSIELNKTPVSRDELAKRLADLARLGHGVVLFASRDVPYEHLVRTLELCRGAGIMKTAVQTASDLDKEITDLTNNLAKLAKTDRDLLAQPERYGRLLAELEDRIRELRSRFPKALASENAKPLARAGNKIAAGGRATAQTQLAQANERLQEAERALQERNKLDPRQTATPRDTDTATPPANTRGDNADNEAKRARLRRAESQYERAKTLYEAKLFSQAELELAQAEVEVAKAQAANDPAAAARAQVRKAETELDRASKLLGEKLISQNEFDSLKYNAEIARAELAQANNLAARNTASDRNAKAEILRLLDEEILIAQEKLNLLKQQQAAGVTSPLPFIRMQAELLALRRTKAAQEGNQPEVARLFDEQIKVLEELETACRAAANSGSQPDGVLTALDVRREILALKRQKAGMSAAPAAP